MRLTVKKVRNSIPGIIIIVAILLVYVSFLLTTNYTSQTNQEHIILEQFHSENSWRATMVSYFFNDRRQDMLNLASSREIDVFFENRALGMSMEYGMRQSLPPIKERFNALLSHHRINEEMIYLQIVLLDENGELLVRAAAPGSYIKLPADTKQLREPGYRSSAVIADEHNRAILISTAYFFKGKYSGQIVAWIDPDYLAHQIIIPRDTSDRKTILVDDTKRISFPAASWPIIDVMDRSKGQPIRFEEKGPTGTLQSMIGLSIPVKDTPFSLVTVASANAVLGKLEPRGLLIGMGILAIAIISGGIYIVRTMTRSLLLRARLEASLWHEQEVREKNLQLEKEVADRKRAEEEREQLIGQLREVNKKLQSLDSMKTNFISMVSHELRTPLTSIKAFVELLLIKRSMPEERKVKLLSTINVETDRLARLISDLLDLARIEAGSMKWQLVDVSIEDLIRHVLTNMEALFASKGLSLTTVFIPPLSRFLGDHDRLVQVVTNILSNAAKFTPSGGAIHIAVRQENDPLAQIVVEISDTGIGMSAADLDLIFEKFHRSYDDRKVSTEGTGLGLAITRQIVEQHGGRIWAASTYGKGSTFTFTIPLQRAADNDMVAGLERARVS
jgi:signal transduction histidine kinase